MQAKFLADENIDAYVIASLRKTGYHVFSVWEESRGITDIEVIRIATTGSQIIITEDKDFGEWVFAHHEASVGIILLRYQYSQREQVTLSLLNTISKHNQDLYGKFTVVSQNKVRIRNI